MENKAGIEKPGIRSLPRIQDRMTFIYLERCRISRVSITSNTHPLYTKLIM